MCSIVIPNVLHILSKIDVISILLGHFVPFLSLQICGTVTFISPTGSVQMKWQNWIFEVQFATLLKYL
jgi:hypothetical protein